MFKDKNVLSHLLFFIFIAVFVVVVVQGLMNYQPGDENVYYYMGKLISEGKAPYKDFFYAHPPLQIYLIALIYKIFGFNIIIMKSVPLIFTLVSAFFIFRIVKEKIGSLEAIVASLLFLFNYTVMFNSVFSFGIEIATAFLVIGIYLLWCRNQYFLSGTFFGLAAISRLLALIPIAVVLILTLSSSRKNFLKLSAAFISVFLLANAAFFLFFGQEYLTFVYKYHFLKSFGSKENFEEYVNILKLNWILFFAAALLIFTKDRGKISLFAIVSTSYLLFLMLLKRIFGFYFIVVFPFLAVVGGYVVVQILRNMRLNKNRFMALCIILLTVFMWNFAADIMFLETDGFKGFERRGDIVEFINSQQKGELFGDASVAPLLALLSNKDIAMDFVDTNNQIFISGVKSLDKTLENLRGKNLLFIIRSREGISSFGEVRNFLNKNCDFLSQFYDKREGAYLIYGCR